MVKAVIFDLNGVIVNDEKFCQEAWRIYCLKNNLKLTEDDFKNHITGSTPKKILNYLYKKNLSEQEVKQKTIEYRDISINLISKYLKPSDGLLDFIKLLQSNNIPIAIASSAEPRYFDFIIDGLKIREYFKVLLNSQDVTKPKPDPEIYLRTANLLKISPKDCVVFEDTVLGIKSAKAAGMKVVAITSTFKRDELKQADKIIDSFQGLTLQDLNT